MACCPVAPADGARGAAAERGLMAGIDRICRITAPGVLAGLAIYVTAAGFGGLAHLVARGLLGVDGTTAYNLTVVDLFGVSVAVVGIVVVRRVVLADTSADEAGVRADYLPGALPDELSERTRAWIRSVARTRWIARRPRRFHPLAAPCYAERAVPELRNRIAHHVHRGRRVLVSAHSQGTVVAFAALEQLRGSEPGVLPHVALATYGCPLATLCARFFPEQFDAPGLCHELRELLPDPPGGRGWANFYRPTDYPGREVFVAPAGELVESHGITHQRLLEARAPLLPFETHSHHTRDEALREWCDAVVTARPRPTEGARHAHGATAARGSAQTGGIAGRDPEPGLSRGRPSPGGRDGR